MHDNEHTVLRAIQYVGSTSRFEIRIARHLSEVRLLIDKEFHYCNVPYEILLKHKIMFDILDAGSGLIFVELIGLLPEVAKLYEAVLLEYLWTLPFVSLGNSDRGCYGYATIFDMQDKINYGEFIAKCATLKVLTEDHTIEY